MAKQITWYTVHPNHYHCFLQKKAVESGIELQSVYSTAVLQKYPWQVEPEEHSILQPGLLGIDWKHIRRVQSNEVVVIAGWNIPTYFMLLTFLSVVGAPFYLYSDTPKIKQRRGLKQWIRQRWINFVLDRATAILTTGQPGVERFVGLDVPRNKIINFPFVTDLDFFKPTVEDNIECSSVTLFSCGRLDIGHKGYDVALRALALLKDTYDFRYFIGGDGPDRARIETMIKDLDLLTQVELLGWMEIDAVLAWFQKCDVFIHPSRFDPFPNAVLEAMACGCVVVASNQAGSAQDRIIHGDNGFLFQSENAAELAEVLKAILVTNRHEDIKRNSRKTAEQWAYPYHISILKSLVID